MRTNKNLGPEKSNLNNMRVFNTELIIQLKRVKKEWRKLINLHFKLHILPTIAKKAHNFWCGLLEQFFLLIITFCTYLENVAILNLKPFEIFCYQFPSARGCSGVETYEAETAANSMLWEVFAKNQMIFMNLRNSFSTIFSPNVNIISNVWNLANHLWQTGLACQVSL
jgi:hypothetical protein